jgi:hypothetical protein
LLTVLQIKEEMAKRVARLVMSTQHLSFSRVTMQEHLEEGEKWGELLTMQSLAA